DLTFSATGGTTGTVTSVNSQLPDGSGNVTVDSDDIDEGATNLYMTTSERSKLSGIAAGAEVNVNADWDSSSGDSQILNKPIIPEDVSDLTDTGGLFFSGSFDDLTDVPTSVAGYGITDVFTKTQTDELLDDYYSITQVDVL